VLGDGRRNFRSVYARFLRRKLPGRAVPPKLCLTDANRPRHVWGSWKFGMSDGNPDPADPSIGKPGMSTLEGCWEVEVCQTGFRCAWQTVRRTGTSSFSCIPSSLITPPRLGRDGLLLIDRVGARLHAMHVDEKGRSEFECFSSADDARRKGP
jgi:hypothetical protein